MMSTLIASARGVPSRPSSRLRAGGACVASICFVAMLLAMAYWPFRYRNVQPLLERLLASKVTVTRYHCVFFPHPGFVAYDLVMRRNTIAGLPPIGSASSLSVQGNWTDFLMLRRRVPLVVVEDLHVVIPAAGTEESRLDFPPGSSSDFSGPATLVSQFGIFGATLEIERPGHSPYIFPVHQLILRDLHQGQPASFVLDMENAVPSGHILASGNFGPLQAKDLSATPVSGSFDFGAVNLADLNGISGTLWSKGHLSGTMGAIGAEVEVAVPRFAVGRGLPTQVQASLHASINSLNGDTIFRSIDLSTGSTSIHAQGSIAGVAKVTHMDIRVTDGRAEDLLRPFLPHTAPITGPAALQSHLSVAPSAGAVSFMNRMKLEGTFSLPAEHLTDRRLERKLSVFSARASQNKPGKLTLEAESEGERPLPDAEFSLNGRALISHSVVTTSDLLFKVPGASILLHGDYNLRGGAVSLLGDLQTRQDLSHLTTGIKSAMLKPIAPFFKGRNAGAVLPIEIKGSPQNYTITEHVFRRP